MRIAQISTLSAPVRHETSGSVESLVWLMTRELTGMGHEVTVFGTADSEVDGELIGTLPGSYGAPGSLDDWHVCEWVNLCRAVSESGRFDVLHTHAYLWGMPLEPFSRARMVHTMHIVPDENAAGLWRRSPQAWVTALSKHQWNAFPELCPAAIIPHGVEVSQFTFREKPDDYICYLGRFVSGKGPRQAIALAQALGVRLILAGPPNAYFRERVQPLVDGKNVQYAGFLQGRERDQLLGGAMALVYPIQYPEAFGLVLVEAMLCGTPVAAMRLGAVPEVVEEGVTGFCADSQEELAAATQKCFALDRQRIREAVVERFSVERMACDYLKVYERIA
jgi:glycosyltransferase involved in cell wall biosynthesis